MENKFQGLPPLKRYRLLQQDLEQQHASSCLPAKKRKQSQDPSSPLTPTATVTVTTASSLCLPAKKRVWAPHPNLLPNNPTPHFDLNVEYKPPFDEEETDPQESDDLPIESKTNQIADNENKEDPDDYDGIECAVCQSTDGDPSDPIVFCDGCDLMVHSTCYGSPLINGIPEGDWFCAQCLASQSAQPGNRRENENGKVGVKSFSCCLCPVAGGAMKPTSDERWAHIVCSVLVPEVFFSDPEGREGIDLSRVPDRRWEQICYVCESGRGCAIDCSEPKCPLAFHVGCGLKEDLCIEFREGRNKGGVVAGFCKKHTELWKKQQETGKFKIVARDEHKK